MRELPDRSYTSGHAVMFDFDDTLFAQRESSQEGLTSYLEGLGGPFAASDPEHEFTRWRTLLDHHYDRYLRGELDHAGQRRARTRDFLAGFGLSLDSDVELDNWFAGYLTRYEQARRAHADVLPCLRSLGNRRFGIITNGKLEIQLETLEALGLGGAFEHVIASSDFGVAKPAPEIFLHACEVFGVAPLEAVYVGDKLHADAIAATLVGMLGVWLDRSGSATDEALVAARDHRVPIIRTLYELSELLD